MSTQTMVQVVGYRLPIVVEQVDGFYQATSPDLQGFLVLADSLEELLALAPGVARALLLAMKEKGLTPPIATEELQLPAQIEVLVPA